MFPYSTAFLLDRTSKTPLFLQLTNQFVVYIREGKLPSMVKLPGSRTLAKELGVHRKVIVACYEELEAQGWVISQPKKGTFVQQGLLVLQPHQHFSSSQNNISQSADFGFYRASLEAQESNELHKGTLYLDDGSPDARLASTVELARIYRRIAGRKRIGQSLGYGGTLGSDILREVLANYLNKTRGLNISKANVLITRGSQMGIYLSAALLVKRGDNFLVGDPNYMSANRVYHDQGAILTKVPVTAKGIDTNAIAAHCNKSKISGVYITPHHHYPSTVTLSAERRLQLLHLANQHKFAIVEDDYDYDFNYEQAPILPLASYDQCKHVIYVGSICKTISPAFRIGYFIAAEDVVTEAAQRRRFIDRQGDMLLELTIAEYIKTGGLERHIRKVNKVYRERRDYFCQQLQQALGQYVEFEIPKGGMAVWLRLNTTFDWETVAKYANQYNLELTKRYEQTPQFIRVGFATYTQQEMDNIIMHLKQSVEQAIANECKSK